MNSNTSKDLLDRFDLEDDDLERAVADAMGALGKSDVSKLYD